MKYITRLYYGLGLLTLMLALTNCEDPITLGSDLLDDDDVGVGFTDTFELQARVVPGDTVLVYGPSRNQRLDNYLFGDYQDPIFGLTTASIYAQVRLESSKPDFSNSTLDSVVLVLPYDTSNVYGKIEDENFGLEVFRVMEPMSNVELYYSNASFARDIKPIATHSFTPSLDSIEVIEYVSSSVQDTLSFPHLRVPLNTGFGSDLLSLDTTITANDSTWLDYFNGIHIQPTQTTAGLLSFDLNDPFRGGIYLYYTQDDTVKRQFHFEIDDFSTRLSTYQHDYTGAPLATFIDNYETSDSLIFLQGMAGVNTELEILGLDPQTFENIIVNKAELELTVRPPDDESLYPPPEQLILSTRQSDGTLRVISDVSLAASGGTGLGAFGGDYDEETGTYTMNISAYLQEVISGDSPNSIILSAFPKAENPERVAIYGPGNSIERVEIRLSFTKL